MASQEGILVSYGHRYLIASIVASAIVLSACAGSGFTYVHTSDNLAFFKVPLGWTTYNKQQILVASGQSLSPATDQTYTFLMGYDSDPHPSIEHVLSLPDAPAYPVIVAQVRTLSPQDQDSMSLASIRNAIYPLDRLAQANAAALLGEKMLSLSGGLHGSQLLYQVSLQGTASVNTGNQVIEVNQIGLVDPAMTKLYLFTVRCEAHCYRDNQKLINQIVQSWTVKER